MGWFWGSSNNDDPVKKLDPGLREYLEHEAPKKYVPAPSSTESAKPVDAQSQSQSSATSDPSQPSVPSKSLYPDGRYAHLWKNYKPPPEETNEVTGAERVIENYKKRNDTVHRAAMENCALEHEALTYCFQTGNWQKQLESRLTLCSDENAKFSRCFTTQSKFLQALGYASSFHQDEEREERIQMHADTLYHQMLSYEEQAKEARKAGQEPPPLTSLFNPQAPPPSQESTSQPGAVEIPGGESIPAGFKPPKNWETLSPHERELEIRTHNANFEQQKLYAQEASPFLKTHEDNRAKRREKATSWFGERVGNWIS
ncbi:uncharacterized protein BDW47DRAFT_103650 [Aspergillus candidus]|uniref:Autophagy protein n=1 Tax=Aspergillus candidus TaxID=41067 RepID=A0A2I2FEM5_ASPCN|nr:hypothetical protein BDW47DRAFT_103650 [Aspergillus candidus]PLB39086.1 hypothetical protein BDW47DRAFT_103650 [Aspergillus candidus]